MSHIGGYGLPTEVVELGIQAPHHRLECARLHYSIEKAIRCYPLCNCSLVPIVGFRIRLVGRAANVRHMRVALLAGSFFTTGGVGSLRIGKNSSLALDSEERASIATMSWAVIMLWD